MSITTEQKEKVVDQIIDIVHEAVDGYTNKGAFNGMPSSHLFLMLEEQLKISLDTYQGLLCVMESRGLIRVLPSHLIKSLKPYTKG